MPSQPTPWRFELSSWPGQSQEYADIRSIKFYGTLILHWKFVVLASRGKLKDHSFVGQFATWKYLNRGTLHLGLT
jgi:hypothetical protein